MSASVMELEKVELTFGEVVQMETCIMVTLEEIRKRMDQDHSEVQKSIAAHAYAQAKIDYGHLKTKLAALYPNTPRT